VPPKPSSDQMRQLVVALPQDLYVWLLEAAEISHRTIDAMVKGLIERERERWDANWDPRNEESTTTE